MQRSHRSADEPYPPGTPGRRRAALSTPAEAARDSAANSAGKAWQIYRRVLVLDRGRRRGHRARLSSAATSALFAASAACSARSDRDFRAITSSTREAVLEIFAPTATAASCAFRWTCAARRSKKFPGSNTPGSAHLCRITSAVDITERTPIAFLRDGSELVARSTLTA